MANNRTNHAAVKTGLCRTAFPYILASLSFLFSSGLVSAASPPMLGEILGKTEADYRNIHAFTAIFHQRTTSAAAGAMSAGEASGRLYYARPRQMRWEYDKPEEQVFVANNRFAWLYVRAENQITLFDADKLFASALARTFFDGAVGLKKYFEVTLDSNQSTGRSAALKLVPRQEDPSVKLLYLWIDLQNYRITRIESHDILENANEIRIESLTPHASLEPRLFHLEVPPSAKVFGADGRELTAAEIEQLKARISSGK
ncbi:MAG: outer membrane lipoprotein carrier protein LolA [Syntrophobacteraceae bacterium]|jgi:outer membrane lipoprotein carrier protein